MGRTFHALRNHNYRRYFTGQVISITGTWMQSVAQAWLVLRLTGSGVALGTVVALQFVPFLVAGPWGGVIADRFDKRRLAMLTQASAGVLALVLGILTATGLVTLWSVYVLAFLLGMVTLVDNPTRQSFVSEMVPPEDLTNAVSLNSVVVNAGRIVGPALAGGLIALVGLSLCFFLNSLSYVAVIVALYGMRTEELRPTGRVARGPGQLREGLRYAWRSPHLRRPLLLMAVVGMLAFNFQTVIPLMARFVFDAGPAAYGVLFAFMGLGAVVGGLVVATRGRADERLLATAGLAFGALILVAAVAPTLAFEAVSLLAIGAANITFIATSNSILQLGSDPAMRGRVMALWGLVFLGTTPIGAPLVGWVAERFGPRFALGLGGVATLLGSIALIMAIRRDTVRIREPVLQA
jgi:MFS family permease